MGRSMRSGLAALARGVGAMVMVCGLAAMSLIFAASALAAPGSFGHNCEDQWSVHGTAYGAYLGTTASAPDSFTGHIRLLSFDKRDAGTELAAYGHLSIYVTKSDGSTVNVDEARVTLPVSAVVAPDASYVEIELQQVTLHSHPGGLNLVIAIAGGSSHDNTPICWEAPGVLTSVQQDIAANNIVALVADLNRLFF